MTVMKKADNVLEQIGHVHHTFSQGIAEHCISAFNLCAPHPPDNTGSFICRRDQDELIRKSSHSKLRRNTIYVSGSKFNDFLCSKKHSCSTIGVHVPPKFSIHSYIH